MNSIIKLLYQLADKAQATDISKKNEISIMIPTYGINFILKSFVDDRVEINFMINETNNLKTVEENGSIFITNINSVKDFVIDFYKKRSIRENRKVIEEVGEQLYNQWIDRSMELLKSPRILPGIKSVEVEAEKTYYDPKNYNLIIENEGTGLKEIISFTNNVEPKHKFDKIEVVSTHFQQFVEPATNILPEKISYLSRHLRFFIPVCDLDSYPFLKEHCAVKNLVDQDNFLEHLRVINNNAELDNLLLYIHLDEKIDVKKENTNKKKL